MADSYTITVTAKTAPPPPPEKVPWNIIMLAVLLGGITILGFTLYKT